MKISSIELLEKLIVDESTGVTKSVDGLLECPKMSLGNIVVLAGKNGAGKTRIIKRLEKYVRDLHSKNDNRELKLWIEKDGEEVQLSKDNVTDIELVNYSHYDAQLQTADKFTPYVISKSKDLLQHYDYGITALNALLLLTDMANGYSEEFKDISVWNRFVEEYLIPFEIILSKNDTNELRFFDNLSVEEVALSPGQRYLFRMAVACFRNEQNPKVIFLLDEPELHLHPQAQISLIDKLRGKFPNAQFWISTHSLSLISHLTSISEDTTLLYISDGKIAVARSDMRELLNGLVGSETNLLSIRQLLSSPDEYACARFALECMNQPAVFDALPKNPQNKLLKTAFEKETKILDYGAGRCRILEEMSHLLNREKIENVKYYAYDAYNTNANRAKTVMKNFGFPISNYFNDKETLLENHAETFDYVLLVNVLHEVPPYEWEETFTTIRNLLNPITGALIIVERSELTVGESPYDEGFLMITRNGADELFGKDNYAYDQLPENEYIVRYTICKEYLNIKLSQIQKCIEAIKINSLEKITTIKNSKPNTEKEKFKQGLSLAFHLNQFANATLISGKIKKEA